MEAWYTDPDAAYAEAQRRIAAWKPELRLDFGDLWALKAIPSEIGTLASLRSLDLNGTSVADLGPLSGLSGLLILDLRYTSVTDLGPVSGLSGLQQLNLGNTLVVDLGPLSGMVGLRELYIHNTRVDDLAPLALLPRLEYLNYSNIPALARDPTLLQLVTLDSGECARQTLLYLKGEHPDLGPPPEGTAPGAPLSPERIASAAPARVTEDNGTLTALPAHAAPSDPARLARLLDAQASFLGMFKGTLGDNLLDKKARIWVNGYIREAKREMEEVNALTLDQTKRMLFSTLDHNDMREAMTGEERDGFRIFDTTHADILAQFTGLEERVEALDALPLAREPTPQEALAQTEALAEALNSEAIRPGVDDSVIRLVELMRDMMAQGMPQPGEDPATPLPPERAKRFRRGIAGMGSFVFNATIFLGAAGGFASGHPQLVAVFETAYRYFAPLFGL